MIKLKEFVADFDLKKFLAMKSFAEKIRYANDKLQKMASGSSRIIYRIDDARVLKLAKNAKGIAQNEVESDYVLNDWYGDIIAKVLESDDDDRWIVSEFAKKIGKSQFKQLLGVSIEDFYKYLYMDVNPNPGFHWTITQDVKDVLDTSEFYEKLRDMIGNFDMEIGDFQRTSTFGEIGNRLVITDYGLTKEVYSTFYKKERK